MIIKNASDEEILNVLVPPNIEPLVITFGSETTVMALISIIKEKVGLDLPNSAIFFPRFGMWLDESHQLFNYNFLDDNIVEFRVRANQIVLRIYIFELDLTIAIKVLPSQTASGILILIIEIFEQ